MSGTKPKPNPKPEGKSGGGGSGSNKDTLIARIAGIVIFTGIAVSVFRAFRPRKPVEELAGAEDGFGVVEEVDGEVKEKTSSFVSGLSKRFHKKKSVEIFKGDTLWSLSRKYGVSVEQLKAANGYTDDTIYAGEKIIIP